MKKFIKLSLLSIILLVFYTNVHAASLNINADKNSVVTGGSIRITVKADGLAGKFSITSSNGNVLSGGTSSVWIENETKTYTFTAKSIGNATIKVVPLDVSDSQGNVFSASKSVTVKVVKPREKSTNNNLKSLTVEGYNLSPEFDKNVLEYTVNLESNIDEITIQAAKEDGYANVSGTGQRKVQEGNNKFEITVTSETGKDKVYTINAIVSDSNPIIKTINEKDYTVVKRASALIKPDFFEEATVNIEEVEVPAFYNEITDITLIGLKDETGKIELYQYNLKEDHCRKYQTLTSPSKTIIFENSQEKIKKYKKITVMIHDQEYEAYQIDNNEDYILIYGMDIETGNKGWYSYHLKEETVQSYMSDVINGIEKDFSEQLKEYKMVILTVCSVALILLIVILVQIISKSKAKKKLITVIKNQQEMIEEMKFYKSEKEETPIKNKKNKKEEEKETKNRSK